MTERRCENCVSYHKIEGGAGECRRDPPVPFMLTIPSGPSILGAPGKMNSVGLQVRFPSSWPAVKDQHWCGKHQVRPNGKEPEAEPSGS